MEPIRTPSGSICLEMDAGRLILRARRGWTEYSNAPSLPYSIFKLEVSIAAPYAEPSADGQYASTLKGMR